MKKIIKRIFKHPLIIIWIFLSVIALTAFTLSYNKELGYNDDKGWSYSLREYDSYEELEERKTTIDEIILEAENEGLTDEEGYIDFIQTRNIYEALLENYVPYEEVYQSGFPTNINDKLVYIDSISEIFYPLIFMFFILSFYISFLLEFDDKTFVYIYDGKNRTDNLFKRVLSSLITTAIFGISCVILVLIFSINYESHINRVLLVQINSVNIVSKGLYLFLYTFLFNFLKLIFISLITISIALLTRKGLTTLISVFGLLMFMVISSMNFSQHIFLLGMGRTFNNYNFKSVYIFVISFLMVLAVFIPFIFSYKRFEKVDLL